MQKKPTLSKRTNRKYHQGIFIPKFPEKYVGNLKEIIYRSKWELLFLKWADTNQSVIRYSSEECVIPYISPIDNKEHRYFMDFYVEIRQEDKIKKFLVEIKPFSQTKPPKKPKNNLITESYKENLKTYIINQAKWKAAKKICDKHGWTFIILTEKELFKNKVRKNGN